MKQHIRNGILYLTGLMGCGKTTLAPLLAARLAWEWMDTDSEIERITGMSIPAIFEKQGEAAFRREERAVLREITQRKRLVVALGGGALTLPRNRALIRGSGTLVFLNVPPALLAERLPADGTRPLLGEGDLLERRRILETMLRSRREQYETADLILTPEDDTPEELCETILICLGAQT
ncbi:shikimate kinase [bacterium]|nr:shikimate kinase [bacterium]